MPVEGWGSSGIRLMQGRARGGPCCVNAVLGAFLVRQLGLSVEVVAYDLHELEASPTVERFTELVLEYERTALEPIADPMIWRAIKRDARALMARGQLSDQEACEAVGDDWPSTLGGL
jgi:hypothetical protein